MEQELPPRTSVPPPILRPPAVPPRARPPGGGRGWMIAALILGFLFLASLLMDLGSLVSFVAGDRLGEQSGQSFEEVVVERAPTSDKIAIIDVEGIITSQLWDRSGRNMVDFIEDQLKSAAKDHRVKAVILKVDSPGGEVLASDDISRAILDFQEEHGKPVVAAMGGLAASGGYYVSAPCQWIVANELTITGSVGVIMQTINYRGLFDKVGLYPMVFKSGKFKDMLGGSKPPQEISPEVTKMIQDMIDETFSKFKRVVADGRKRAFNENSGAGRALAKDWEEFADGRILTGRQAYDLGFVDELGNFETAVERTKKLAGLAEANLIRYQEPFDFGRLFSLFGESGKSAVKLDVGMDLPELKFGRPYFLSPVLLP